LNAISPTPALQLPPEPATSDLDILQRLIVVASQLADLAARQANEEATPPQPDQAAKQPPRAGRADPKVIFLRLRRAIQETIAFRNRLAAGILTMASREPAPRPAREPAPHPPSQPAPITPEAPQDPRRPHILGYFRESNEINRKRRKNPITQAHIEERVTAELASDPQQKIPGHAILLRLCKSLDIPFYATRLPPDLFRPPRPA